MTKKFASSTISNIGHIQFLFRKIGCWQYELNEINNVSEFISIFLQKSYPDLPEEGKMHFTVYNGFEGCTLGGVGNKNVTMYQKDEKSAKIINQISFDFQNATTKYQSWKNAEQGQW